MTTKSNRAIAAATAAAIALTSLSVVPAMAAPASDHRAVTAARDTDFSAARRRFTRGDRMFLGAVAGVFGTVATLAARDRYYRHYGYGPYYGGYGPYYGPPPAPYGYYGGPYRYYPY
jgi:hypothetical protein